MTCLQLTRKKKNACGLDPLASGHLPGQPVSLLCFFPPLLPSPFLLSFLLSCLPLVMLFTGFLFWMWSVSCFFPTWFALKGNKVEKAHTLLLQDLWLVLCYKLTGCCNVSCITWATVGVKDSLYTCFLFSSKYLKKFLWMRSPFFPSFFLPSLLPCFLPFSFFLSLSLSLFHIPHFSFLWNYIILCWKKLKW